MQKPSTCVFDVIICGGGLAGLTLARQIRLSIPQATVAIIERTARPLPEAAHKVGESSVEIGTHYFGSVLQLDDYFRDRHLPKLGLRYFFGDSQESLHGRAELGPSLFPPVPSYQIDRGRLENDLREFVQQMGVQLIEDHVVCDIELSECDKPHEVWYRHRRGEDKQVLRGRWVVDALSRRRLLQNKLNLKQESAHAASAAWWRMAGRLDIQDLVPPSRARWHRRVLEDRYLSTNHIMGRGYWIWFIPLASENTSIGIVTDESIHPFSTYGRSYDQARSWLQQHEPRLAKFIDDRTPSDFHGLKNYSYASQQVFSLRRWSCVGEAAVFVDPFYSPGSDFIAYGNTITTTMIKLDLDGQLTADIVDKYNYLFLDVLTDGCCHIYRDAYKTFGHAHIFAAKHLWDAVNYWGIFAQFFFQGVLERPHELPPLFHLLEEYRELFIRMQRLFVDWAERVPAREPFEFLDSSQIPLLQLLNLDLNSSKTTDELHQTLRLNLSLFDELAQVLFFQAVSECFPEKLSLFTQPLWVNTRAISLRPDDWEDDGLFAPATEARDLAPIKVNTRGFFAPVPRGEAIKQAVLGRLRNLFGGRLFYRFVHLYVENFVKNKPGLRIRRTFVKDQCHSEPAPVANGQSRSPVTPLEKV